MINLFKLLLITTLFSCNSYSQSKLEQKKLTWKEVQPGFSILRYAIGKNDYIFRSEIILLKFSLNNFEFEIAQKSNNSNKKTTDVKSLTNLNKGIAGINASFFDKKESPLGLIIQNKKTTNKLHKGGTLLSGIFYISNNQANIIHKSKIDLYNPDLAIQAGPRLISNYIPLKIKDPNTRTRRSGIAINKKGEVIIYATLLRFPGASFSEVQEMLKSLSVKDALNFDGGSSSQLYLKKNPALDDDFLISGGDDIPVALVVKKRVLK